MTSIAMDVTKQITISIYVRRDVHENGMTLKEYADAVIAGTHPVLEHDKYVYQFGALEDEIALVNEWARANGLTVVESHTGMALVQLSGTAGQFNQLFNITLNEVTDSIRTYHTHTGDVTVPSEINDVVQSVLGLDNSVYFKHNAIPDPAVDSPIGPNLISSPSPVDLALSYKFPRLPGSDAMQGKGATVAICSLSGGYSTQNLTSTFSRIGLPNPTVVTVNVDGGGGSITNDPYGGNPENMLDIYCVGAAAPASKIIFYSAPNTFGSFVNVAFAAANDTVNNPSVLSISWGTVDSYFGIGQGSYLAAFDAAFQSCIVRGITVVIASGDYGVRAISSAQTYTLNHPSTSPYVVSAGGTVISINNDHSINSEQPWGTSGGSYAAGGGVSTIYPVPSWQTGLTSKLYPSGTVSALSGRGTPDVSAMATGYMFYYGPSNSFGSFVGTSATAPLLSALVARLNALTGRRLGFVNADWYSIGSTAFNDMTSGDNHGGNSVGYMAQAGWDAASGLGTPKGDELYKFYKKGSASVFPKPSFGFRTSGAVYPRTRGIR
jgi:kumamolisin